VSGEVIAGMGGTRYTTVDPLISSSSPLRTFVGGVETPTLRHVYERVRTTVCTVRRGRRGRGKRRKDHSPS
jgi:hypothetical protein